MLSLGIDIGGSSVKLAAVEIDAAPADGCVVATALSARYSRPTTSQLLDAIRDAAAGISTANGLFDSIGLCVPGVLDEMKSRVTTAVNVPGLVGISLHDLVREGLNGAV